MASRPQISWSPRPVSAPPPPRLYAVETVANFSALEWSIVAMAEQDRLISLRRPNRFWSIINTIFGISLPNRLASDRLEALHRVAVLVWRGSTVSRAELEAFFDVGFSEPHFERLQGRIDAAKVRPVRKTAR